MMINTIILLLGILTLLLALVQLGLQKRISRLESSEEDVEVLKEKNKKLRDALKFYADGTTYELTGEKVYTGHGSYDEDCWREIERDLGEKARQALEQSK